MDKIDNLMQAGDRKVIRAQLKPRSTEQMGLGATLCVHPGGTERHLETPELPTAPANYSLFLCGLFELSICDGYSSQITTFK